MRPEQIAHIQRYLCNTDDDFWRMFQSLGDCARYRIVKVLMHHRKVTVTDLARICMISVPSASQHLRLLKEVGIVRKEKHGLEVHYEINTANPFVDKVVSIIDFYLDAKDTAPKSSASPQRTGA